MYHAACFPSLTDSTVVLATPARSPPTNTFGSEDTMVSGSTSGTPQLLNLRGAIACTTARRRERERLGDASSLFMPIIETVEVATDTLNYLLKYLCFRRAQSQRLR